MSLNSRRTFEATVDMQTTCLNDHLNVMSHIFHTADAACSCWSSPNFSDWLMRWYQDDASFASQVKHEASLET